MVTLAAGSVHAKHFRNKRFFLHVRGRANTLGSELIKAFGGQIDEFLECGVSYVLTDVPKSEWPKDETLKRAIKSGVKLMSFNDLLDWCSWYLKSQSSSDEDDETKAQINNLDGAYIKFEPLRGNYAPVARELKTLPMLNLAPKLGTPIFLDPHPPTSTPTVSLNTTNNLQHNSAQLTPQAISSRNNQLTHISITPNVKSASIQVPTPQLKFIPDPAAAQLKQQHNSAQSMKPLRRRHPAYCEICNQKSIMNIEEHSKSTSHLANMERLDWSIVHSVIRSIPDMENLKNVGRPPPAENHEFVCLHKVGSVESVSQLFRNAIN